jgi:hypothetical protein
MRKNKKSLALILQDWTAEQCVEANDHSYILAVLDLERLVQELQRGQAGIWRPMLCAG